MSPIPRHTLQRSKRSVVFVLILLMSLCLLTPAHAKPEDSEQPITIEADRAKVDEKKGESIYSGNVLLMQGGIQIKADELIVRSKNGELDRLIATGKPVIYSQQGTSDKGNIVGEAYKMEYFADEGKLILLNNAKLSQGMNLFKGNRISYDTKLEVVSATVSDSGKQRVQVTIQPKSIKSEDE